MSDPFAEVGLAELSSRRSLKWSRYPPGVLAAWVADMDLPTPSFVASVIGRRVAAGELGYPPDGYLDDVVAAFVGWAGRRWSWSVDPDRVVVVTDVMTGIGQLIEALTEPGDEILLPTPAYPPFLGRLAELDRSLIEVPLRSGPGGPTFDLEALDAAVTARSRMLLVTNPHNPTGRMFTRSELEEIASFADRRGLWVVADEIHADLGHDGAVHLPMASVSAAAARRTATVTAATKAFNLAGFRCAVVVMAEDDEMARRFARRPPSVRGEVSALSAEVTVVAWTEGDAWLADLCDALTARRDHLARRLREDCPAVGFDPPEATFLAWLDVSAFDLGPDPGARLVETARLALNSGPDFGRAGVGHVRMNFATPWAVLDEAVDRLATGLDAAPPAGVRVPLDGTGEGEPGT